MAASASDWRTDRAAYAAHLNAAVPLAPAALHGSSTRPRLDFDAVKNFVVTRLRAFSGADPVVINGASTRIAERGSKAGKDAARAFLAQEYRALGFTVSTQSYARGINFIAEKAGSDPSHVVIVSAHLDSVRNAGADDDGSGTIGALAVATGLKDQRFSSTLRILGFDNEEDGLVGSTNYVKSLSAAERGRIVGLVNLEMISYNSRKDGAYHVIDCDRPNSVPLTDAFLRAVGSAQLPLRRSATCTDRSDHAAFWKAGIPAIVISQNFFGGDANPCYHKACDQVSPALNFDYMANLVLAARGTVSDLLHPIAVP